MSKQCRLLTILLFVLLTAGCATPSVIDAATKRRSVPDRVDEITRAFIDPEGRLLVCLAGALPDTSKPQKYMLDIPLSKFLAETNKVIEVYTANISLPRSVLRKGWPSESVVEKEHLRPVDVRLHERSYGGLAEFAALQPADNADGTVYEFTPKDERLFAYVRRSPLLDDKTYVTFTLNQQVQSPAYFAWILLPVAVGVDVATAPIWVPVAIIAGVGISDWYEQTMK